MYQGFMPPAYFPQTGQNGQVIDRSPQFGGPAFGGQVIDRSPVMGTTGGPYGQVIDRSPQFGASQYGAPFLSRLPNWNAYMYGR